MTRTDALGHEYKANADGTITVIAFGVSERLTAVDARAYWRYSASEAAKSAQADTMVAAHLAQYGRQR